MFAERNALESNLIREECHFKWYSYLRCQYIDEETVALMAQSGRISVFPGIESVNETILKNMNKQANVKTYQDGIALLKKHNVITFVSFIIGFHGETRATVQDVIAFIKECGPDFYRAQLWYCDPITPVWNRRNKFGVEGEQFHWKHNAMNSL